MKILNLTQHPATGVFEPADKKAVQALLTFEELPTSADIKDRVSKLLDVVEAANPDAAMIGGASYLMEPLEAGLTRKGLRPLHAFTKRVLVEDLQPDGTVKKTSIFKHVGFVG